MRKKINILLSCLILILFLTSNSFSQVNLRTDPRIKNVKDNSGRLIPRCNFQEKIHQLKKANLKSSNSSTIENSDASSDPIIEDWAAIYSTPYSDFLTDMAIDGSGNVYVTGFTYGDGIITIKYNSAGDSVWVARHSTGGSYAISVDGSGNVYVAGVDTGAIIIKYSSSGVEQWSKNYIGPADYDIFSDIALDAVGNIYVSGFSFDVGCDMIAVKYNPVGDLQWVYRYPQPDNFDVFTFPIPIALDLSNNAYITNMLILDLDLPNTDYLTVKLNSNGIQQWAKTFDGNGDYDFPNAIAVDNFGDIAVTGGITESDFTTSYATVLYNTSGEEQWARKYPNSYIGATDIKFDQSRNIYVTGSASDVNHPEDYTDYVTIQYNIYGVSLWVAKYGGIIHSGDYGWSLALDGAGNVYVTGQSSSLNDLYWEYGTVSYDPFGNQRWEVRYAKTSTSDNYAHHIAVTGYGYGDVYVAGYTYDALSYQDFATVKYHHEIISPVELTSFTSAINNRDVVLNWTTASEINNSGFNIERSNDKGQISNEWIKVGYILGKGTINNPSSYSFTDRGLMTGKYNYRLKQIDFNGNFEYFNLNNEVNIGIPNKFNLSQNYPNPFNPTTKINYDIPFDGNVNLTLFDIAGREVAKLVNEVQSTGYYTVEFNGANLPSGIYFYRLSSENSVQSYSETKKMNLIK